MAARVDPRHVSSRHQSMHHFVANAEWDDLAMLRVARTTVLDAMERHGAVAGWIVDDTGIPKKGRRVLRDSTVEFWESRTTARWPSV
jgi:SRSO17 transposase